MITGNLLHDVFVGRSREHHLSMEDANAVMQCHSTNIPSFYLTCLSLLVIQAYFNH